MAAAPPSPKPSPPRSPSVMCVLANRDGVREIKQMMSSGVHADLRMRIRIPRLERLDAAPGICRALGRALGKWKDRVAPNQACSVLHYVKVKAASTVSRDLVKVSSIVDRVMASPANLPLYSRLDDLGRMIRESARHLPHPARRRVRRLADRVRRLATRGNKYGARRPHRIRYHGEVLRGKITRLQGKPVVIFAEE